ncbi:vWA domain-containing protein [Radiobacillus sp. PE A8.2]|uniref:vWA domain-containing protein n=1 Tax=Radiobacillus sp. PE A8.2 TaxID=3380349 RepID=UPI003890479D
MGVLAPISFLFLLAIPVLLLFYFFKKQYQKQTISSIYLWERTMQEWETDRWWKRLQKNLLLLLQLLILLFLIIALLRPYLSGNEVGGDHLVIILDSSATMTAEADGLSRFAQIKTEAKQLVSELGSDHKVSVIDAQQAPLLLATNDSDHGRVEQVINDLSVSYQHENLTDSIGLAQALIQQEAGEIHIFTDQFAEQALTDLSISQPIVVHNQEPELTNYSIQAFGVKQDGDTVAAIVHVNNQSSKAEEINVSISSGATALESVTETIPANSEQTVMIENLPVHDFYKAEINQDDYALDNSSYALLQKQQSPSIYLVGEVNGFFEKALLSAGYAVTTLTKDESGTYAYPEQNQHSIYLLSGVDAEDWPSGPKLVVSPTVGGPFAVEEKVELSYVLQETKDDPLLQYSDANDVYLSKSYAVGNWNQLEPLVQSGEQTVIAKGEYENAPFLMMAFDLEDSDWPLHPGFPILLANSINYLAESNQPLGYFEPMDNVEMKLSTATEAAVIETLDGNDIQTIELSEPMVTIPSEPGMYQLHEKTTTGPMYRSFAVQLDAEERTIETASSFSIDIEGQQTSDTNINKIELWHLFALVALLIMFFEWEVYRRGVASR